jgi:hypothetical protein
MAYETGTPLLSLQDLITAHLLSLLPNADLSKPVIQDLNPLKDAYLGRPAQKTMRTVAAFRPNDAS